MGADRGKVGSGVVNVGIGHVGGDRFQDLQDLGTVGAATEQGEGEVLSHGRARIGGQLKDQGSGCQVGRGTAGAVEGDHGLCLLQGAEELRAPFAGIVGDLIADFVAGHGFRLKWGGGPSPPPTVVKDLTQDLSRWRVVSLGGFASESIIGVGGGWGTPPCASLSGGHQHVVLPAGIAEDLTVQQVRDLIHQELMLLTLLIRLQDGGFALGGDLIDGDGAIGGRVVAHGVCLN